MTSVIVTRPDGRHDPLVAALEARGFAVHAVPTVRREPAAADGPLWRAMASLDADDWIVLTSRAAVGVLATAARATAARATAACAGDMAPTRLPARLAVVGPGTAVAAAQARLPIALVAEPASGAGLVRGLGESGLVSGRRCLLLRADIGGAGLAAALSDAGGLVSEIVAYHIVEAPAASRSAMARALADPDLTAVVFASGSAVRGYVRLTARALPALGPARCAVTIGPSTTRAALESGLSVLAEARQPGIQGLIGAVIAACAPPRRGEATS